MSGVARAAALKLTLALTVALALMFAVTASQAAKAKKVGSEVEISGIYLPPPDLDPLIIVGDVHSRKPKCERQRKVTLYFNAPGGERQNFGSATTDRTGDWEIVPPSFEDGDYVAEVDRKRIGKGDKKLICKADTSPRAAPPPL